MRRRSTLHPIHVQFIHISMIFCWTIANIYTCILIFIYVNILSCYILALVLTYFWMTKDHVTFLDLKQLLRVSCILWCYFSKWYSIIVNKDFIVDQLALGREHHEKAIYIAPHICIIYVLKYDFLLNSSQHMHIFRCINVQIYMYVLIDAVIL